MKNTWTAARSGLFAIIIGLTGCGERTQEQEPAAGDETLSIYAVNYPLQYLAQRIVGERAEVRFPGPTEGDPAFWTPPPDTVVEFQNADLILLNGAEYAKWIGRVSLPPTRLLNTSEGFSDQWLPIEDQATHSHGPEGDHQHGNLAFTTWLDPAQAVEQARAIQNALAELRPGEAAEFERAFTELESELLALDAEIEEIVAANRSTRVIYSHPVYQYFQRRYGIHGRSVHWEPGEMPTDTMWNSLADLLEAHPAKWMIWEDTPLPEIVSRLDSLGLGSAVVKPCATPPDEGDFLSVMRQNVADLKEVYR